MKIKRKPNLAVAEKILAELEKNKTFTSIKLKKCWLECFDNNREQGYVIKYPLNDAKTLYIAFTEDRSSDDIVIYVYKKNLISTNLPAKNEWDNKTYFGYTETKKASKYIYDTIINCEN